MARDTSTHGTDVRSILSISSHVCHGYVGNRAMTFPLQFTGWDVDTINTTDYSNHPGYGKFSGSATSVQLVQQLFQGLKDIVDFHREYQIVLTGYSPNDAILQTVYDELIPIFASAKGENILWVVDPVLGDNGKLYVPQAVVPIYKKILSSGYVTLTTPNQFEFETLTGVAITSWSSLKSAFAQFHSLFPAIPYVVLSSVVIENNLYSIGYSQKGIFHVKVDQINCNFNGCGDVFTALLTNEFYLHNSQLTPQVLTSVLVKLHKILQRSLDLEREKVGSGVSINVVKDIRIVSSRHVLLEDNSDNDLLARVGYL